MARAGLKQMTRTPEAKLGHFIVDLPLRESAISSNRRVAISPFRPGTFRFRLLRQC